MGRCDIGRLSGVLFSDSGHYDKGYPFLSTGQSRQTGEGLVVGARTPFARRFQFHKTLIGVPGLPPMSQLGPSYLENDRVRVEQTCRGLVAVMVWDTI